MRWRRVVGVATFAILLTASSIGRSADDDLGLGSGADGAFTASSVDQVINAYAAVTAPAVAGSSALTIAGGTTDFGVGDVVMVMQVKGAPLTSTPTDPPPVVDLIVADAGQYDVVKVTAKTATSLSVGPALKSAYRARGAQVIRVPQYTTVSVPDGMSLTAAPWSGTTGGVVAFLAQGAVTMTGSGTVHADAKGFRGGLRSLKYASTSAEESRVPTDDALCHTGGKGESLDDAPSAYGPAGCGVGARGTGGGGGGIERASGGGGGNAGPGGRGDTGFGFSRAAASLLGGYPGAAVNAALLDRLTFGGGGGGGQQDPNGVTCYGRLASGFILTFDCTKPYDPAVILDVSPDPASFGPGGAGGGVVWLRGLQLSASSAIRSNGSPGGFGGQVGSHSLVQGGGGAGAGGSIVVRIVRSAHCSIEAKGADHGGAPYRGGAGGAGRVRLESRGGTCPATATSGAGVTTPQGESWGWPGASPSAPVEDAGASGFGCVDSGACASATPVCDLLVHACRACKASIECGTGSCGPDGRCTTNPASDASTSPAVDAGPPPPATVDASTAAEPSRSDAMLFEAAGGGCQANSAGVRSLSSAWSVPSALAVVLATLARRRRRAAQMSR